MDTPGLRTCLEAFDDIGPAHDVVLDDNEALAAFPPFAHDPPVGVRVAGDVHPDGVIRSTRRHNIVAAGERIQDLQQALK